MKVNFPSRMNLYAKMQAERAANVKGGLSSGKTDVAEFSRGSASSLDKNLLGVKHSIQNDIYSATSPQRLEQLKQAIKTGKYHIPTDDMIKALLDE
jgi:anti-sigma28 factor (negative regulator of flagellin synthesis)